MELETISNTKPERSGATGGSGAAGWDAPNFCDGKPAERFRKPQVKACGPGGQPAGVGRCNGHAIAAPDSLIHDGQYREWDVLVYAGGRHVPAAGSTVYTNDISREAVISAIESCRTRGTFALACEAWKTGPHAPVVAEAEMYRGGGRPGFAKAFRLGSIKSVLGAQHDDRVAEIRRMEEWLAAADAGAKARREADN